MTTLWNRLRNLLAKYSFIRFACVGVGNTIVGYGTSSLFYNILTVNPLIVRENISTLLGTIIGAILSYFLNRRFTFRSKESIQNSFPKFALVIILCYLFSFTLIQNFVVHSVIDNITFVSISDKFEFYLATAIGTGVYIISNYFGQKLFAFRNKGK